LGLIGRMQYYLFPLAQILLVDFLSSQRLAALTIHHKVEGRNLIRNRVAEVHLNVAVLEFIAYFQVLAIMLF
jgi:hypothetical protein